VNAYGAVPQGTQKSPALSGFFWLRPQTAEADTLTSESHDRYWTTAIRKMGAQKNGKSKFPVWKVGFSKMFAKTSSHKRMIA
jgi:hypothetical protein